MLLGHDIVADRKPQAGPLAGRLGREERLEQLVLDLDWNTGAVIADADFNCISEISRRHLQVRLEVWVASLPLVFGGGVEAIAE